MNNLIKIKAMHYWMKYNWNQPVPEDYVDYYIAKFGVDDDSNYDVADEVLDYTDKDIEEEINCMDNIVNNNYSEDCESLEELSEQIKPSFK